MNTIDVFKNKSNVTREKPEGVKAFIFSIDQYEADMYEYKQRFKTIFNVMGDRCGISNNVNDYIVPQSIYRYIRIHFPDVSHAISELNTNRTIIEKNDAPKMLPFIRAMNDSLIKVNQIKDKIKQLKSDYASELDNGMLVQSVGKRKSIPDTNIFDVINSPADFVIGSGHTKKMFLNPSRISSSIPRLITDVRSYPHFSKEDMRILTVFNRFSFNTYVPMLETIYGFNQPNTDFLIMNNNNNTMALQANHTTNKIYHYCVLGELSTIDYSTDSLMTLARHLYRISSNIKMGTIKI